MTVLHVDSALGHSESADMAHFGPAARKDPPWSQLGAAGMGEYIEIGQLVPRSTRTKVNSYLSHFVPSKLGPKKLHSGQLVPKAPPKNTSVSDYMGSQNWVGRSEFFFFCKFFF